MPDEIYEIIALAARYWFLLLMGLIAWRSYRWYIKDRKKYKRRLRLLPDAGYIGELVVVEGDETVKRGTCFPISREGVLGYMRSNDVSIPAGGIANRHMWYTFDDTDGLCVEPLRGRVIIADGQELIGKRKRAFLAHGSVLIVGQAKMRLRMFSGFEYAGELSTHAKAFDDGDNDISAELAEKSPADPVRRMHEIADWQTMLEDEEDEEYTRDFYPPEMDDDDDDDGDDVYLPPMSNTQTAGDTFAHEDDEFYPPVIDDEDARDYQEMLTDEHDQQATRAPWDHLFKGDRPS